MRQEFHEIIQDSEVLKTIDAIEVGCLDLTHGNLDKFLYTNKNKYTSSIAFDLASVTKILTNGLISQINKEVISEELRLCLEHRSGIPAWGYLSKRTWKRDILNYKIKASELLYSDFGAIRAQLIFEEKTGLSLYEEVSKIWDTEVFHWLDCNKKFQFLNTGMRNKEKILGEVHDPNAFNLRFKVSHAGLFATTDGLLKTIFNVFKDGSLSKILIDSKNKNPSARFHYGWDTPQGNDSLAGVGQSKYCFGHLGFTGTCLWVDLKSGHAISILSNVTRDGWFNKAALNTVRRKINTIFWSNQ